VGREEGRQEEGGGHERVCGQRQMAIHRPRFLVRWRQGGGLAAVGVGGVVLAAAVLADAMRDADMVRPPHPRHNAASFGGLVGKSFFFTRGHSSHSQCCMSGMMGGLSRVQVLPS